MGRYLTVNVGAGLLSFVIFRKPLRAASACAISFRGKDFAELLTDSIIQKIGKLHQSGTLSELLVLALPL
jgi:hypothetical protein